MKNIYFSDSEIIASCLDDFRYDESKKEEVLNKYRKQFVNKV